jgi:glycyl-tRNA synthetase
MADVACPHCGTKGQWTEPRMFNGLLQTYLGPVEDESGLHYLRPETAQGIFVNFKNVEQSTRRKPPFGIGQIGKSFRNEITPGNFIFRTREFEQMEMEFFVAPGTDEEWHQYWIDARTDWYDGPRHRRDNLRLFEHPKEKLSHYSKRTVDIEYRFGFPGSEWGRARGHRQPHRLRPDDALEHSGTTCRTSTRRRNARWTPYVIEPAAGLTRSLMAFLIEAYSEDEAPKAKGGVDTRTVLKLDPRLAPVKAAVLPLSAQRRPLAEGDGPGADAAQNWNVDFDDAGRSAAGYRRPGRDRAPRSASPSTSTPSRTTRWTIRERDTMRQERVPLSAVTQWLSTPSSAAEVGRRSGFVSCGAPAECHLPSRPRRRPAVARHQAIARVRTAPVRVPARVPRIVSMMGVHGWLRANPCSQVGIVAMGTKALLA